MGAVSGFKLGGKFRKDSTSETSRILLPTKACKGDISTGFSLGADDYISKPFSVNELIARVKAVLKRSYTDKISNRSILQFNGIDLDTVRKRLMINDERIELTKKEYEILKTLLENQGKVFSREDLLMRIWGHDIIVTERTVDVNITRLRTKLGQFGPCLKNKTGYGYFFEF
jgi:DNA-binding response OmpR family regulator